MPEPIIPHRVILVEPEVPENIGFVVRAMSCFGWSRLVLVNARRPDPDSPAFRTATLGKEILAQAREASSLQEAFGDARTTVAFTRRPHQKGLVPLPHLAQGSDVHEAPWALVFGRESIGLTSEEVMACDVACSIPTVHPTGSLNLGQAAAIALAFLHEVPTRPVGSEGEGSALAAAREAWAGWVGDEIEKRGLLHPARLEAGRRHLSSILRRMRPSDGELRFLQGLSRRLVKGPEADGKGTSGE
jgi:TrmH family RNA methyltransferase